MRYHGHKLNIRLKKIRSLATRRVLDELIAKMTTKKVNSLRIDKEDRLNLAVGAECSHTQVVKSLAELVSVDILERQKRGLYMINPEFLYTGHMEKQTVDMELYRTRRQKRLREEAAEQAEQDKERMSA